jgi:protein phosphatase
MSTEHDGANASNPDLRLEAANVVTASATDVGRVRSVNQDAFGEFEHSSRGLQLLVIADGMGGHRAGEVASEIAIKAAGEVFGSSNESPGELLRSALSAANTQIFDAASGDPGLAGMGTTGVALLITGESRCWIGHVGDSRAYRLRGSVFTQLTDDHSVVGELVKRGQLTAEEARVHPQSNEILRALGTQQSVEVELTPVDVEPGDRFLLCSDGLSGMLPDPKIAEILAGSDPSEAVATLIDQANEAGGTDNITVQIAEIAAKPSQPKTAGTPVTAPSTGSEGSKAAVNTLLTLNPLLAVSAVALVIVILVILFSGNGEG